MVPANTESISKEYKILLKELKLYNPELMDKPRLLAITKTDLVDTKEKSALKRKVPKGIQYCMISAVQQEGLSELKDMLWDMINKEK